LLLKLVELFGGLNLVLQSLTCFVLL
jgi:hypothetical protein